MALITGTRLLGEILVADGGTTPEMITAGLNRMQTTGERLGEALVGLGAVTKDDVLKALAVQNNLPYLFRGELPSQLPVVKNLSVNHLRDMAFEAPVIRLVNLLVESAIAAEASDIHIEPFEDTLRVRYRIDGILFDQESPPRRLRDAVTSRIKLMAEMNIAERRLPQDGRIRVSLHGRRVDIRV